MTTETTEIDMSDEAQREAYITSLFDGYHRDSRLTSGLLIYATLRNQRPDSPAINRDIQIVRGAAKAFEAEVWYEGGVQVENERSRERGFSFHDGNYSVLLYTIAGRTLITFSDEDKSSEVTLITSEDEGPREDGSGPMGIQGISATAEDAVALINRARQLKRASSLTFTPSNEVHIAGF